MIDVRAPYAVRLRQAARLFRVIGVLLYVTACAAQFVGCVSIVIACLPCWAMYMAAADLTSSEAGQASGLPIARLL